MPDVNVVSNSQRPLHEILREELRYADEFRAASAFLNSGGLSHIMPDLQRILEDEGSVYLIHGADFRITDPQAIRDLATLSMRYGNMSYRIHCDWWLTIGRSFHPKIYVTTSDYHNYCAVIGSSNLTQGGMSENAEINAVMRGNRSEIPIMQSLGVFESMLNNTALLQPDIAFVEKYEYLHRNATALPILEEPPYELSDLYEELIALHSVISPSWKPCNQVEYIVKALENLSQGRNQIFHDLSSIYEEAGRLARTARERYKWDTFSNSVRGRLNDNTVGRGGRDLFERRGGVAGRYGQYRLSERGRAYGRSKTEGSSV